MAKETILNSVEEVIEDFRNGKIVIVVDDEDRENEGDFIVAAEKITPEIVNFMLKEGRGVLCAPLSEARCAALVLHLQAILLLVKFRSEFFLLIFSEGFHIENNQDIH